MRRRALGFVAAVALGLTGALAFAQQPQPGGLPAGHPALDVPPAGRPMPGQPGQPGQPGSLRPQIGQPGQPGRPGLPQGLRPQPRPVVEEHEEHAAGHGAGHCPGHGPNDAPHFDSINWWHGIISVNNEKAQAGGFVNQLLWRYQNPSDACDPKNEQPPFLAALFNIGVLGFIVYRFGKKPIADALVARKRTIMSEIDNASQLKAASEKRLSEYEDKFERIEEALAAMKAEYAAQGEHEKKHVVAEAEERRARMVRDAEFRVEQELRAARVLLMHEAVVNATAAAEDIIRKRAAQADLDRMSEEYLSSVRAALAPGGGASLRGGA